MVRKPTALITGAAGFAGSFLTEELLRAGYAVVGTALPGESLDNLVEVRGNVDLVRLDITRAGGCEKLVRKVKPATVWHLAAYASVGGSFGREREVFRVNVEGTLNVLEAARQVRGLRRLLFVSSPDCYGVFTPKNKTLTEGQPLNPVSPYGISKAAAERACLHYFRQYGLRVVVARAFNHCGPRQGDGFAVASFAKQIAAIEAGRRRPVIAVGDLSARRDLSDVRDIVSGYRLVVEKGRPGEVYNLCSGRAVEIRAVLETLRALSHRKIKIRVDPARLRKTDLPVLRGSNRKAVQALGFAARYTLKATLRETLDYWRERSA